MKDFRGFRSETFSHGKPMREVISDVVSQERFHGHGIAADDADFPSSSRSGFRGHGGAQINAMRPIEAFTNQGGYPCPSCTKKDRTERNALWIFPIRSNR